MKIKFVEYDNEYLDLSWMWLNDPEIKDLIMAPDITKESQKQWYDELKARNDYYIWGIKDGNVRIGAVGIKRVNLKDKSGEYFGYIGNKKYWGLGIGTNMIEYIINFAKTKQLSTVYLWVSRSNSRAIRLYEKNGFLLNSDECDDVMLHYYKNIE